MEQEEPKKWLEEDEDLVLCCVYQILICNELAIMESYNLQDKILKHKVYRNDVKKAWKKYWKELRRVEKLSSETARDSLQYYADMNDLVEEVISYDLKKLKDSIKKEVVKHNYKEPDLITEVTFLDVITCIAKNIYDYRCEELEGKIIYSYESKSGYVMSCPPKKALANYNFEICKRLYDNVTEEVAKSVGIDTNYKIKSREIQEYIDALGHVLQDAQFIADCVNKAEKMNKPKRKRNKEYGI